LDEDVSDEEDNKYKIVVANGLDIFGQPIGGSKKNVINNIMAYLIIKFWNHVLPSLVLFVVHSFLLFLAAKVYIFLLCDNHCYWL